MSARRQIRFAEALARGFGLARRAPGVVAFGWAAETAALLLGFGAQALLGVLVLRALAEALFGQALRLALDAPPAPGLFSLPPALLPAAGAALVAWGLVLVLRLLWLTGGARLFSLRLAGERAPFGLALLVDRLGAAVAVALLFVPIGLGALLFGATLLGASGLVWTRALQTGRGGLLGSAALALALVLAFLLTQAVGVLFRLAVVRAVAEGCGPVRALRKAAGLVLERLGLVAGLLVLYGLLTALAGAAAGSGGAVLVGEGSSALLVAGLARTASGVLGGLLLAGLATAELGAWSLLDAAARGRLPEPPPPPPVLETEPVLAAEPILGTEVILSTERG